MLTAGSHVCRSYDELVDAIALRVIELNVSQAKQVAGTAEDLYGQAKDAAASVTDVVQRTIEQPAIAIAVAVGWLLGRTHRPL
jgi:hypothetical protein